MKKILLLVLAFVMFKVGYSQYPIQQFIGADSAVVTSKGGLQGRFINVVFADTTAANSQRVRQYPGAMIYASGKLWVRNTTATGWTELAYGPIQVTNIYNSDGTLTGNRELDGDGNNLTFTAVRKFSLSGDSLDYTLDPAGNLRIGLGNQQFIMRGDTASLSRRLSYTGNLGSSFTKHSVVDKNYVDSSITASPSGTVTSVGLSMPAAFAVANSPVTSSGTLTVTGAGVASQYIRGDGQLATLPTTGGGGSSVSYYLNGSVNQGTFGGTPYYEMSKTPIFGAGTDFNISSNGYIASFITDAGDPALLNIPAGNWDFEVYFQSSSSSGTPSFYVELYKYNGTTFTLIASSSANPEFITGGTSVDAYYTPLSVPNTSLLVTDRLAVRIYVNNSGNTITLHTEDNNLCQIITTFSTGINALNGLTSQVQYFATGTSGTDFNISSLTDTHTFNLPTASATNRGALSSADWTTFNNKGSVSSIATNTATGITGGTITTTGTLAIDTNLISTRAWRQKGIDSVASIANGKISGSGTTNYVSKFTASGTIGNSQIFDNGTQIGIGTSSVASYGTILEVRGPSSNPNNVIVATTNTWTQLSAGTGLRLGTGATSGNTYGVIDVLQSGGNSAGGNLVIVPQGGVVGIGTTSPSGSYRLDVSGNIRTTTGAAFATSSGNVLIGTTTDAGYKLDVSGTTRISGTELRLDNATTGTINLYSNTPTINFFSGGGYSIGRSSTSVEIKSSGNIALYIGANQGYGLDATNGHLFKSAISGSASLARLTTGGNLIVGGTTDAGFRADIQGTLRVSGTATFSGTIKTNTIDKNDQNNPLQIYTAYNNINAIIEFWGGTGARLQYNTNTRVLFPSINADISIGTSSLKFNNIYGTNGYFETVLGVGTTSPNASSILDLTSTTKGFLPPRMTTTQKNAITSPATGLVVFDTTLNKLSVYTGAGWETVTSL